MNEEVIEPAAVEVEPVAVEVIEDVPPVAVEVSETDPVAVAAPEPEPEPEPEPAPVVIEPVVEVAVDAVEPKPEPKPTPAPKKPRNPVVVVSGGEVDTVYITKCVYKNKFERKSLTVHHLQRRLVELGYKEAGSDADGYYGDLTKSAVHKYQVDNGIAASGLMDVDTFINIFNGDPNVDPVL
jgi:hypothetical protein